MVNDARLVETFLALCRLNSPPRAERPVADWVRSRLEELGLRTREDGAGAAVGGNAGNVLGSLPAAVEGAPVILLNAHMDTVEPNPDVTIIREGDVIRTDGAAILGADDKAGIAPILEALQVIVENGLPHGPIEVAFTICEEVGLLGAANLDLGEIGAEMGFVFDSGPPVGSYIVNAPGHVRFDVRVLGKAAHAGNCPERGVSAIEAACEAVAGMRLGRIDEETTANVGSFHGGEVMNIVCDEVRIVAEARSLNAAKLDEQARHMRERFEAAVRRGARVEIEETPTFRSYKKTEKDAVVRVAVAAAERLGLNARLKSAGGGSDANVFNHAGLPSVVVCTGMREVHTHGEFCTVGDLVKTAELALAVVGEAAER